MKGLGGKSQIADTDFADFEPHSSKDLGEKQIWFQLLQPHGVEVSAKTSDMVSLPQPHSSKDSAKNHRYSIAIPQLHSSKDLGQS